MSQFDDKLNQIMQGLIEAGSAVDQRHGAKDPDYKAKVASSKRLQGELPLTGEKNPPKEPKGPSADEQAGLGQGRWQKRFQKPKEEAVSSEDMEKTAQCGKGSYWCPIDKRCKPHDKDIAKALEEKE